MRRIVIIAMALVALSLGHAAAQTKELGVALRRFGIAPITDVNRLVYLGCLGARKITKSLKALKKTKAEDGTYRSYEYGGFRFITIADQVEVEFSSTLSPGGFVRWGVFDSAEPSADEVTRRYGAPAKEEGGALWYYSDEDERATVRILIADDKVTRVDWSCY
jgi:hypothetical protein